MTRLGDAGHGRAFEASTMQVHRAVGARKRRDGQASADQVVTIA
ncbi:MAG: hypothetical protein R3B99_07670 [Polyangiales bacterium]